MTKTSVAELFGVRTRTIEAWVRRGSFPPPLRIGRRVWWDRDVLQQWIMAQVGTTNPIRRESQSNN